MDTNSDSGIGRKIDAKRLELGFTQVQLADLAGIPRTTLQRKMRNPGTYTLDEIAAISTALGVTADYWLAAA
jgi:transcriptional regulator with XRE-family HTH domain